MKEEVKNLWVEALRSGKYKQGRTALRNSNDEFCCLGVLCDLSEKITWHKQSYFPYIFKFYYVANSNKNEDDFSMNVLPQEVQHWAGMKYQSGAILQKLSLILLNDNGYSFKQIADVIEENWEEL